MGQIYEQFEAELHQWSKDYAGRPREQMIRLFLLALEREEIVSIGYRDEIISARLNVMPIPEREREIIRHALLWIWKDEEIHAIFIRGVILRLGNFRLRTRAFMTQMAGAIGGWSTSVRQHVRWRDAPLSRAVATFNTWAGRLAGKIPRGVQQHLTYSSFRDFCLFNVDAEKTAWLCWTRLIELAAKEQLLEPTLIDEFQRIADDEHRHGCIFEVLAATLNDDDRLVSDSTETSLAQQIGAVGEFFLPHSLRTPTENPLGKGGVVQVARGTSVHDKVTQFRRLLENSCIRDNLIDRARTLHKELEDIHVAIKTAFMLGYHRKDQSIITDPELLQELALFLRECGCGDVAVIEAGNLYDRFYRNRTVENVARYFEIHSPHFRIVDVSAEQVPHSYSRGMAQYTIGQTWKDADFRISFAKLRSHPVELVYLTMGNLESVAARCDEFIFTERQAQRETGVMMLLDEFPAHFSLIDGYELGADGLVGVMGCAHPPTPLRFYAGADALSVDMVAANHMGHPDPRESNILREACYWFGDPRGNITIDGPDEPLPVWRNPHHTEFSTLLSLLALPVYVLGSGRGALFVPEMDTNAFPPLQPETLPMRLARRGIQTLLRLRR